MRVAIWDVDADWVAMKNGDACMSMGERCWENDYSFVWVMRRFIIACFRVDLKDVSSSQMFENIAHSYSIPNQTGLHGNNI